MDKYKVIFKREFAIEKKATPPNTGLACQEKNSKKYFRFGLAHSPAIESHTASKPSDTDSMKKRTNVCMGNSGINPLKHLWVQTSWVGSGFDHSEGRVRSGAVRLDWGQLWCSRGKSGASDRLHTTAVNCSGF